MFYISEKLKIYSKLGLWKMEENSNSNILGYFRKTKIGTKKPKIYSKLGSWKMEENPKNFRIFSKDWNEKNPKSI